MIQSQSHGGLPPESGGGASEGRDREVPRTSSSSHPPPSSTSSVPPPRFGGPHRVHRHDSRDSASSAAARDWRRPARGHEVYRRDDRVLKDRWKDRKRWDRPPRPPPPHSSFRDGAPRDSRDFHRDSVRDSRDSRDYHSSSRDYPRDSLRDSPRDLPRDAQRDSSRDLPRDSPRDSREYHSSSRDFRDPPRSDSRSDLPRDLPRDSGRDRPRDSEYPSRDYRDSNRFSGPPRSRMAYEEDRRDSRKRPSFQRPEPRKDHHSHPPREGGASNSRNHESTRAPKKFLKRPGDKFRDLMTSTREPKEEQQPKSSDGKSENSREQSPFGSNGHSSQENVNKTANGGETPAAKKPKLESSKEEATNKETPIVAEVIIEDKKDPEQKPDQNLEQKPDQNLEQKLEQNPEQKPEQKLEQKPEQKPEQNLEQRLEQKPEQKTDSVPAKQDLSKEESVPEAGSENLREKPVEVPAKPDKQPVEKVTEKQPLKIVPEKKPAEKKPAEKAAQKADKVVSEKVIPGKAVISEVVEDAMEVDSSPEAPNSQLPQERAFYERLIKNYKELTDVVKPQKYTQKSWSAPAPSRESSKLIAEREHQLKAEIEQRRKEFAAHKKFSEKLTVELDAEAQADSAAAASSSGGGRGGGGGGGSGAHAGESKPQTTSGAHPRTRSRDDDGGQGGGSASNSSAVAAGSSTSGAAAPSRRNRERHSRAHGDVARSEAEFLEILASLEAQTARDPLVRARLTSARVPDQSQTPGESIFTTTNALVVDHSVLLKRLDVDAVDDFTEEQHLRFIDAYVQWPKEFGKIANVVQRSFNDCVMHYYRTKKEANYKRILAQRTKKKRGRKPRKKPEEEVVATSEQPTPSTEQPTPELPSTEEPSVAPAEATSAASSAPPVVPPEVTTEVPPKAPAIVVPEVVAPGVVAPTAAPVPTIPPNLPQPVLPEVVAPRGSSPVTGDETETVDMNPAGSQLSQMETLATAALFQMPSIPETELVAFEKLLNVHGPQFDVIAMQLEKPLHVIEQIYNAYMARIGPASFSNHTPVPAKPAQFLGPPTGVFAPRSKPVRAVHQYVIPSVVQPLHVTAEQDAPEPAPLSAPVGAPVSAVEPVAEPEEEDPEPSISQQLVDSPASSIADNNKPTTPPPALATQETDRRLDFDLTVKPPLIPPVLPRLETGHNPSPLYPFSGFQVSYERH